MRKLQSGRLVIASHNEGKVREIRDLLGPYGIEPVSARELDLPEPDEIGTTFIDNADLKAREAADLSGLPALADDSGLCVDALNGMPGVLSARWAGRSRDDAANNALLLAQLADVPPHRRGAAFRCAAALVVPATARGPGVEHVVVAEVRGRLLDAPRGSGGFGYDPLFVPDGHDLTTAQLSAAEKDAISHRGKALRQIAPLLWQELASR